ncbi:MAG: DinB family protein [Terriglobales bacterium]
MPDHDQLLREHLLYLLRGSGAHIKFEDAVKDFPPELRGKKTRALPYTAWQLLEHMRIAQWDILDFCINPNYKELEWPAAYWPEPAAPPNDAAWEKSGRQFRSDLRRMQKLVEDPATALFARIPWGSGQTILREALLVADHNAYHLGQLVLVRKLLAS